MSKGVEALCEKDLIELVERAPNRQKGEIIRNCTRLRHSL